jgi:hypothetical protein
MAMPDSKPVDKLSPQDWEQHPVQATDLFALNQGFDQSIVQSLFSVTAQHP